MKEMNTMKKTIDDQHHQRIQEIQQQYENQIRMLRQQHEQVRPSHILFV